MYLHPPRNTPLGFSVAGGLILLTHTARFSVISLAFPSTHFSAGTSVLLRAAHERQRLWGERLRSPRASFVTDLHVAVSRGCDPQGIACFILEPVLLLGIAGGSSALLHPDPLLSKCRIGCLPDELKIRFRPFGCGRSVSCVSPALSQPAHTWSCTCLLPY